MKLVKSILLFLLLISSGLSSQSILRVSYSRLGATQVYNVSNYETLRYKLKGESRFRKDKIVKMQDSSILFENYTEIKLNQVKALRLKTHNHLVTTLQTIFFMGGVGFVTLNTINNAITDTSPLFNEKAAYISAALLATGFLIREIGIKRIRMTKNKDLKILNIDYQHMNSDSTSVSN